MKMKYELIIHYIEDLVVSGQLNQGQKLPSIRSIATKFNCNKATVIRAYKELEAEHKIYAIPKSGYYLVEKSNNYDYDDVGTIDFSTATPDAQLLPFEEFNHSINRAIELYKHDLFSYGTSEGLESLRRVLLNHLSECQIFTSVDNLLITSGSQQALNILSKMPFPNGKTKILVEQPSYSVVQRLVELNGDTLIGISRDFDGIDFDELESIFRDEDIKFFYTIPRFHNPLGTRYSEKEKMKLVELAAKHDVYIVEDDYLGDLDTNRKAFPLYYYDTSARVIYLKSFSKAFMPGIRIGAVVLHKQLRTAFLQYKRCFDLHTSVLAQGALEIFLNSGMYNNHIKKVRLEYKRKMDYLRKCLEEVFIDGAEFYVPETGFFVWIKLPQGVSTARLVERLEKKNIYVLPASKFFIGNNSRESSLRICISQLDEHSIQVGIRMLFEEANNLIKKR